MTLRNLLVIFAAAVISLACYQKAQRDRYSAEVSNAMHLVRNNYVEPVESRDLFEGAMRGMMASLGDPHSVYIGPDKLPGFKEGLGQEFGGVGILVELHPETKRLTVMSPLVNTPAHRAGILTGDTILEIDGKSTKGMDLDEAVKHMRGLRGTPVVVRIRHLGEEDTHELSIVRDIIPVDSVLGDTRHPDQTWNFALEEDPDIAFLRLTTFGEHTAEELEKALTSENLDAKAIVLDLRNNAGGYLETAVEICEMFLPPGREIVSTRGRGGEIQSSYTSRTTPLVRDDVPLVILINQLSASASEIVAACLQDNKRAVIVGERSYGKGTVQTIIHLEGRSSAIKLTTASYWRPSGENINRRANATESDQWGVRPTPGFEVQLDEDQERKLIEARRDRDLRQLVGPGSSPDEEAADDEEPPEKDVEPYDDPQLRQAIEYLQRKFNERRAA